MSYVSKFESLWPRVTRLDGGVWNPLMSGLRRVRAAGRYIIEVVLTVGPGSAVWAVDALGALYPRLKTLCGCGNGCKAEVMEVLGRSRNSTLQ